MNKKWQPNKAWEKELQEYERQEQSGTGDPVTPLSEEKRKRQEGAARQYGKRNFKPFDYSLS